MTKAERLQRSVQRLQNEHEQLQTSAATRLSQLDKRRELLAAQIHHQLQASQKRRAFLIGEYVLSQLPPASTLYADIFIGLDATLTKRNERALFGLDD